MNITPVLATGVVDALLHSTQFLVFFAIALGALIALGFAVIFGGHHDVEHEFGNHDASVEHNEDNQPAPSFLSPRIFFAFAVGFGVAGAGATAFRFNPAMASLFGVLAGLFMGFIAWLMTCFMYKQQVNSNIRPNDVVGKNGVVVTSIQRDGGVGEANITVRGQVVPYMVMSENGDPIETGKMIVVTKDLGDRVVVKLAAT